MQSLSSDATAPRRSRLTLWLIVAACAAPMIASYVAYYVWRPSGHVNYGELIAPRPLPAQPLQTITGHPFSWADLRGNWLLVIAHTADCDERCRRNLVYTRQVRLAQGAEAERIARVWLITDRLAPDARVLADQPGLIAVRMDRAAVASALPASGNVSDHIYVVDPLGNVMMRFPPDPDPRRMLKDLSRLLRHSKWK
jgi:hypothetical protein